MQNSTGQVFRLFRRSIALALALVALWVTARTADFSGCSRFFQSISQNSALAVSLLGSQLHTTTDQSPPLDRWTQLVVAQSPLLLSGKDAVIHRLTAAPDDPLPADPAKPSVPLQPNSPPEPIAPSEPADEDLSEPPLTEPVDENSNIIAQTMQPSASQNYLRAGEVYIANRASKTVDTAALAEAPLNLTLGDGPQVLILHTHGSEAYTPSGSDVYKESDPYRTTNCNYNMVRVGEEIAQIFRQAGLSVIHDTTLYDYPSYNEAYDRSLAAVERWKSQFPSIQIILDVHRDALAAEDGTIYKAVSQEDGQQVAQVMLVVGTDGNKSYHPLWKENLSFAIRLQQQMLNDYDTLARPMVLRASRFNQHLSVGSVLVEVGTHGNTLQEALAGARLFARSAAQVLTGLEKAS